VVPKRQVRIVRRGGEEKQRRKTLSAQSGAVSLDAAASASMQLDVRGKRYVEAEPLVDRWLDEAHLLGLTRLRLIHGKGTGLLARGLQEFLRSHAQIKSLRFGAADEGGSGVTILEL
jgi:dsDNA-specific endonuclease/ATPase MutS2